MRSALILGGFVLGAHACCQVPDVRVKFDLTLALRVDRNQKTIFKPYNVFGRHSTVSLIFYLEPGFRGFVSEKIQPFPGEVDRQPFDEYYIEDEGIWRVGKQYLPFGTGQILRESVLAARGDTNLLIEQFPVAVALCDGGSGYQRGVVARIGTRTGVSIAYGRHFGIASTALTLIRRPENSPGRDHGWKLALGADYTRKLKDITLRAEGVALREGETRTDEDLTLGDLSLTYQAGRSQSFLVGYTRMFPNGADVFRASASFKVTDTINFEPILRYRNLKIFDASLELRIRF